MLLNVALNFRQKRKRKKKNRKKIYFHLQHFNEVTAVPSSFLTEHKTNDVIFTKHENEAEEFRDATASWVLTCEPQLFYCSCCISKKLKIIYQ